MSHVQMWGWTARNEVSLNDHAASQDAKHKADCSNNHAASKATPLDKLRCPCEVSEPVSEAAELSQARLKVDRRKNDSMCEGRQGDEI